MGSYSDCIAGAREQAFSELLRQRLIKAIPIAQPAAGADWAVTVPGGTWWDILSFRTRIFTSAVVANRFPVVTYTNAAGEYARVRTPAAVPASQGAVFAGARGIGSAYGASDSTGLIVGIPDLPCGPGDVIATLTANIDVGDQWQPGVMYVREWNVAELNQAAAWLETREGR